MKRLNNKKGQALVEFALVAPILLILVLGVYDFSKAWYYENALDVGVRAGVRHASELYPAPVKDDSGITSYVQTEIASYAPSMPTGSITVKVDPPTAPNYLVTVRASYTFEEPILATLNKVLNIFYKGSIPTSFTLQRTGTMYYELGTT